MKGGAMIGCPNSTVEAQQNLQLKHRHRQHKECSRTTHTTHSYVIYPHRDTHPLHYFSLSLLLGNYYAG